MTLLDKFVDGENTIPLHPFLAAIHLVLRGKINRNQLVSLFNLDDTAGNDKEQLDTIQSLFQNRNSNEKKEFYNDFKAVMYLWENGRITKLQAKTLLEL